MKKHLYVISGISNEELSGWKDSMRSDIKFINYDETTVLPMIELSAMDASIMRTKMIVENVQRYHYGMEPFRLREVL